MKKITALLVFSLAVSLVGVAQTSTHKPSAGKKGSSTGTTSKTASQSPVRSDPGLATEVSPQLTDRTADLPTGTAIKMKLETPLSSRDSKDGDGFSGRVTENVVVNGRTIIPVGASLTGRVLRASDPARIGGVGSLQLLPESVLLPNGKSFAINAAIVDTSMPNKLNVDEEGRIKGNGLSQGDKVEIAAGTGAGAVVGAIVGGGEGFLIGSVVGGGTTIMHWLTKHHTAAVPAGTELIMEISRPMNVSGTMLTAGE